MASKHRIIITALCAVGTVLTGCASVATSSAAAGAVAREAQGSADGGDGAWIGLFTEKGPAEMAETLALEQRLGRRFASIMWFIDFAHPFPAEAAENAWAAGSIPNVTWEPWVWGESDKIHLSDINAGTWDAYISEWGAAAAKFGRPLFVSVVLGPCAGGAVYSPAMTDFIFMVKGVSNMYITGPDVVKTVTGEEVTHEELGGALTHATKSGVATFVADDEQHCIEQVRYLLSFLPSNNLEDPPHFVADDDPERSCDALMDLIPETANRAYDMKKVIADIVDDGEFFEVFPLWAMNIVCGFARVDGHVIGIVGNQPQVLAGCLDIDASEKAARFVRTCDAFNVPLVTFVDVPGFLPGTDQEYGGIIRHGAKLLYAYCEATVPRVQIITRKGYGGAYVVMNSKSIGADIAFAWPSAEIAVMGADGAVNIIHRKEIESAPDAESRRAELKLEYEDRFLNPYQAAERGYVDDVIDPRDTRRMLVRSLEMLRTKREQLPSRKHGNTPL